MKKEEHIYKEVNAAGQCGLLKGNEDARQLANMFFTPKGLEFCTKNNVPTLKSLSQYSSEEIIKYDFYVNAPVKAKNLKRVALIGSGTVAELEYTETEGYPVVLMHGAKAKITASGYSVVILTNAGGEVEIIKNDFATILYDR